MHPAAALQRCIRVVMIAFALTTWCGCAQSVRIVSEWRDPKTPAPARTLIVTSAEKQPGIRRIVEDEFSAELVERGISTSTAYSRFPDDEDLPKPEFYKAIRATGVEGALFVRSVRVDTRTEVIPGYPRFQPSFGGGWGGGRYGRFGSPFGGYWSYYDPPQVYQYEIATIEADLYRVDTESLVWSAVTTVTTPIFSRERIRALAARIGDSLQEASLIVPAAGEVEK